MRYKKAIKLAKWARFEFLRSLVGWLLDSAGWCLVTLVDISTLALPRYKLHEGGECEIWAPSAGNEQCASKYSHSGEIWARVLSSSIVLTDSSQFVVSGYLVVSSDNFRMRKRIPSNGRRFSYFDDDIAVVKKSEQLQVYDRAIFLGGDGASNWYHFIIEVLPKLHALNEASDKFLDWPLLVHEQCREVASFRDALAIFARGREVFFVKGGERVLVNQLMVIDNISFGPFNLYPGLWPCIDDYYTNEGLLKGYFSQLRDTYGVYQSKLGNRKIFLARPVVRRTYNQEQIIEIVKRYDFEICYPEVMSLSDQARLFSQARVIVGASGAAWTNLLFCSAGVKGLSWLPRETLHKYPSYGLI